MNIWKLANDGSLNQETADLPVAMEGQVRVRVTKVLLDKTDALIKKGIVKTPSSLIPGRFAVGRVSNDSAKFPAGTRVVLPTFIPRPDTKTAKKKFDEFDFDVVGLTTNGYFRDFVVLSEDLVTEIPESVSDEAALLTEFAALAKATVDLLDVQKGQHIAVIGGDLLGNFMCSLLMWQQASPILIDNYEERLSFAKQSGIYYTYFIDDSLTDNVGGITGGNMADGAIYITDSGSSDKQLPFKLCARNKTVVYSGFQNHSFDVDLTYVIRKNLQLYGIGSGEGYTSTALNLIATKAIDLSAYEIHSFSMRELDSAYETLSTSKDVRTLHIAELL